MTVRSPSDSRAAGSFSMAGAPEKLDLSTITYHEKRGELYND